MASTYMGVQSHGFGGTQVHLIAYGLLDPSRFSGCTECHMIEKGSAAAEDGSSSPKRRDAQAKLLQFLAWWWWGTGRGPGWGKMTNCEILYILKSCSENVGGGVLP